MSPAANHGQAHFSEAPWTEQSSKQDEPGDWGPSSFSCRVSDTCFQRLVVGEASLFPRTGSQEILRESLLLY